MKRPCGELYIHRKELTLKPYEEETLVNVK
jgi:hypothetical protein